MKIYLIGMYADKEDGGNVQCIMKATTSYEAAKAFALDRVNQIKNDKNHTDVTVYTNDSAVEWEVFYKYNVKEGDILYGKEYDWLIRIEEVDLVGEDVPDKMKPLLERRCESLEKHNDFLKAENSELRKQISAAQCYLTFYDGGKYESFNHLLDGIHSARTILQGEEKGNGYILKLFENWKKNEEMNK